MRPAVKMPQIFLNERGHPLTANGLEWLLRGYGQQIDLHLTPHQLRHTFARQMTEAGMPITSLGKLLGHAQVSTTQIYTAGADPQLAEAYQSAMTRLVGKPSNASAVGTDSTAASSHANRTRRTTTFSATSPRWRRLGA